MRIVFMVAPGSLFSAAGSGTGGAEVIVYTQPDRPAGRGQRLYASPVKQVCHRARAANRAAGKFSSARRRRLASWPSWGRKVIVVAAFGQILPPAVLEIPRWGCLNIHPSLLPRYRGAALGPRQRTGRGRVHRGEHHAP